MFRSFLSPILLLAFFSRAAFALQPGGPVSLNVAEQWIAPGTPVVLHVPPGAVAERLAIFLGNADVTAAFRQSKPGEYVFQQGLYPLPQGAQTLTVYSVSSDGQWAEVTRFGLNVLSAGGFEESEVQTSMTFTVDSQWDEGHSGDSLPPERSTFHDGSLQAGLQTRHARQGLEVSSAANLVGATYEQSRLRYAEKGDKAPAVDLSDYLVQATTEDAGFAAGHIVSGNNPLLFSGVANRGVLGSYRLNDYFDVGLSWQNGTAIAGYDNPLGVAEGSRHYIAGSTFGWDVFPGGDNPLRVELSYLRGRVESLSDFDTGEVTDAEQSRGWGVRLLGQAAQGRLRYDGSFARSRFVNPDDPFLAEGDELVPVEETTDEARFLEFAYDLFVADPLQGGKGLNTTVIVTHERTDPLYRSLGAFPQADVERNRLVLQNTLGASSLVLSYSESEDNLDNIESLLKTRTRDATALLDVPLNEYWGNPDEPVQYYPTLSLSLQRVHQYALNSPGAAGDFNADSHLPDQVNDIANLALSWALSRWDFGYQLGYSRQDNRQTGRENADFEAWSHFVDLYFRPTDRLAINFSVGRVDTRDEEQQLNTLADTGAFGITYQMSDRLDLSANYSKSYDHDSLDLASARADTYDLGVSYRFEAPFSAERKWPGQFFVRYAGNDSENEDNLFGFNSNAGSWAITSGLSIGY